LYRLNLPDIAERLQMPRQMRPPAGDADPVTPSGQGLHDMAAQKTGAAENGHELRGLQYFGHGGLRSASPCLNRFLGKGKERGCGIPQALRSI
jgi:hypothetical protein